MRFGTSSRVTNGGSALVADTAPNTAEPVADRVLETPSSPTGARLRLVATAVGGTSYAVQLWVRDPGMGRWFSLLASAAVVAADAAVDLGVDLPLGARLFPEITAVTGATAAGFAVAYR